MGETYSITSMTIYLLRKIHTKNNSLRLALASQRKKFHPADNAFWNQVYTNIMEIEKNYITISYIEKFILPKKNFRSVKPFLDICSYWYFWEKKSSETIIPESKKFFFTSNKEKRLFSFYLESIVNYSFEDIIDQISDSSEKWSCNFSLPVLLYTLLIPDFSHKELQLLGKWFNTPSPKYVWINNQNFDYQTLMTTVKEKFSLLEIQSVYKSFIVTDHRPIQQLREFQDGKIIIQDLGATIISQLIPKVYGTVIDLCASPGNKTVQIFDKYNENDEILIYAGDVPGSRYKNLVSRLTYLIQASVDHVVENGVELLKMRSQSKSLVVKPWDGTNLQFTENFADLVFIDAPCTGTGTMGSKPEVRLQLTDEFLNSHLTLQKALLAESHRIVKPNGLIFYSTCSLLKEENEQQIFGFLSSHPNYSIIPLQHHLNYPKLIINGSIKLFPPLSKTDGFFAILLQKLNSPVLDGNN